MGGEGAGRPSILWIACHDINPDLGCYADSWPGAEYAETPNLDRLAAEGVRFEQCFSVAPVCAPSRSALITGMYPTAIGTMHMRSRAVPPPEVRCFSEYLRAAGYYCTNNSFTDYNFESPITAWDDCSERAHWRNRPDPAQPFFAAFHTSVTHQSQIYAEDEQYQRNTAALRPEQRHDPAAAPLPPYYPDTPVMRRAWARYSDNVTAMDHWAGELLGELEQDGLTESTMVVFLSDHGRGMPRAKYWPYEAGLRVPLLVRWPGTIPPGTVRSEPVGLVDVGPTMLAAAGVPVPAHMHGRPLFDADGRFAPPQGYVFGHRDRMGADEDTIRTVRDARFRYIRNYYPDRPHFFYSEYNRDFSMVRELRLFEALESFTLQFGGLPDALTDAQRLFLAQRKPAEELYDHSVDPHEIHNLADDPSYDADLQRLRDALEHWQQTYGDLGLIDEAELVERWRPGGIGKTTEPPQLKIVDGQIVATCSTLGASIAWTTDPPPDPPATALSARDQAALLLNWFSSLPSSLEAPGPPNPERAEDRRWWRLYSGPFAPPPTTPIWFRACRLGYNDSTDVPLASAPGRQLQLRD